MKKIIFTVVISSLMSIVSVAQVRVGPFLGYGEGLGLWGLGVHTELLINDKISINPVFIQYFPKELSSFRKSAWEVDLNANYYLLSGNVGYLYGLGGINYTQIRTRDLNLLSEQMVSKGNIGVNAGLGTLVRVNNILPFAEVKYTLGGYSQLSIFAGVKFQLGAESLEDDF